MSTAGVEDNFISAERTPTSPNSSTPASPSKTHYKHKRIPAEKSVSLRHGILSSSAAEPFKPFVVPPSLRRGSPKGNRGLPASSKFGQTTTQKQQPHDSSLRKEEQQQLMHDVVEPTFNPSGGSNDRSVHEDWFKNWDMNVGDFNKPNLADGDSPYYLPSERQQKKPKRKTDQRNPSNIFSVASGENIRAGGVDLLRPTQFYDPSLPPMPPAPDSEDESDVYRSVIDDLTIKNKKLKKKLRKLERLHCSELNEEKLFEIRCYGLPPARKQELQELLQRFADGLDGAPGAVFETKNSNGIYNSNPAASPNLSSSSNLVNTDSAYATETRITSLDGGSGGVSKARSQMDAVPEKRRATSSVSSGGISIQFASERAKMKLVVKRLEQLFTGSDALQINLEAAKFQQHLAEEAAQEKQDSVIDGLAESGDEEDKREADILLSGKRDVQAKDKARRLSFDTSHQRPTRPKDLDPNRAQVAVDNMEYLQHMSLSSSTPHLSSKPAVAGDSTKWFYLNLINNMAQIHTLNVSLPFIQNSIRTLSDKLELSSDGNKVRWKGGLTGTRLSSDAENTASGVENSSASGSSPGKSSATHSQENLLSSAGKLEPKSISPKETSHSSSPGVIPGDVTAVDNFRYRPLIFHSFTPVKSSSEDSSVRDGSDSESESDTNASGVRPVILEPGTNIGLSDIRKFAPIDGPIIYFGGGGFCTDLSAQIVFREGGKPFQNPSDAISYDRLVETPIGHSAIGKEEEGEMKLDERPLSNYNWNSQDIEMDMDNGPNSDLFKLTPIPLTPMETYPTVMPQPTPLAVSGIGGTRPEDNFVVYVKTLQKPVRSHRLNNQLLKKLRHTRPAGSLKALFEGVSEAPDATEFENEVTSAIQISLQPSELPDPVFALSLSENSSDPFASTDEPQSYESRPSFADNIEDDSRSSGEGVPSFYSPETVDESPMDLDGDVDVDLQDLLLPPSVMATRVT